MTDSETFATKQKFFVEPAAKIFNFYLCGEIKEAEEYIEWFQILRSVGETDIVYIRINSEGGDLFSTLQLVRAIQESCYDYLLSRRNLYECCHSGFPEC